jgi:hypothetical protein
LKTKLVNRDVFTSLYSAPNLKTKEKGDLGLSKTKLI